MTVQMQIPIPSLQGYPKMAAMMGDFQDLAIFRRFGSLTMLNLLSLQADLVEIEEKLRLKQLADDAAAAAGLMPDYSTNVVRLNASEASTENDPDHPNQKYLLEMSRTKLIEYQQLLLSASQVAELQNPEESQIKSLRRWLRHENDGGANFLEGLQYFRTYAKPDIKKVGDSEEQRELIAMQRDLVAVTKHGSQSGDLATWFSPKLVTAYHALVRSHHVPIHSTGGKAFVYEDSRVLRTFSWTISLLATITASILPSLIILWLSHVDRTVVRVWITIGCTVSIGLFLKLFTNANMKEIFGGAAAFAAIEVVFIGTANGR